MPGLMDFLGNIFGGGGATAPAAAAPKGLTDPALYAQQPPEFHLPFAYKLAMLGSSINRSYGGKGGMDVGGLAQAYMENQKTQYDWQVEQAEKKRKLDLVRKYAEKTGNTELMDLFEADPDAAIKYVFGVEAEKAKPHEGKVAGERIVDPVTGRVIYEPPPPPPPSWLGDTAAGGETAAPAAAEPSTVTPSTMEPSMGAARAASGDLASGAAPVAMTAPAPASDSTSPMVPPVGLVLSPARQAHLDRLKTARNTQDNMARAGAVSADQYSKNMDAIRDDEIRLYDEQEKENAAVGTAKLASEKQAADLKKQAADLKKLDVELKRKEWSANPTPEALVAMGFSPEDATALMGVSTELRDKIVEKRLEERAVPKAPDYVTITNPETGEVDTINKNSPEGQAELENKTGPGGWIVKSTPLIEAGQTEYEREASKEFVKGTADLRKQSELAQNSLAMYDIAEQGLNTGIETGAMAPYRQTFNRWAIDLGVASPETVDKVAGGELIAAIANRMAMIARNPESGGGLPGAVSNVDLAFLRESQIGLDRTAEGNLRLIEVMRRMDRRKVELAGLLDDYEMTSMGKKKTPSSAEWNKIKKKYADEHPLFADMAKASGTTPVPEAASKEGITQREWDAMDPKDRELWP